MHADRRRAERRRSEQRVTIDRPRTPDRPARRDRAEHERRPRRVAGRRRARRRRPDRRRRPLARGPRGRVRDRRLGRDRDAGDDRHPPPHVADGAAGIRRRLDAHPVLRVVLPGVGQDLPPPGRLRREPAVGHRGPRRRRDDDRRLVARPPDGGPRRRGRRRAAGRSRSLRARLRQPPAGAVGVGELARLPELRDPALQSRRRHARLPDGVRCHRRPGVSGAGRVRGGTRARRAGDDARGRVGSDGRRRDPADARARVHDAREHLRPRGDAGARLLPPDRRLRRLGVGLDRERAERRPGLPADVAAARARDPGVAVDGHERVVERRPVLGDAHNARRRSLARAPRGTRPPGDRHPSSPARRAGGGLGDPRGQPGTAARLASWAASRRARRPTSC